MPIQELAPEQFPFVAALIQKPEEMPEVSAVLRGTSTGWVFADCADSPTAALVWVRAMEGFYLIGNPHSGLFSSQLSSLVTDQLSDRLKDAGLEYFEVSCDRPEWSVVLREQFKLDDFATSTQLIYQLPQEGLEQYLTEGTDDPSLRIVSPETAPSFASGLVKEKVDFFWGTEHPIPSHMLGVAASANGTVVSLCLSAFSVENMMVVDVETIEPFRGKGHGLKAGQRFVSECVKAGLQPYWDCMESNIASRKLAEKLGLVLTRTYTLYTLRLAR